MNDSHPGWTMPLSKGQFVERVFTAFIQGCCASTPGLLAPLLGGLQEREVDPVLPEPVTHSEKVYKTLATEEMVHTAKWMAEIVAVVIYETIIQKTQKMLVVFSTDCHQNENKI